MVMHPLIWLPLLLRVQRRGCCASARELDDAILHLRNNEKELGLIEFQTQGDPEQVIAHEALMLANKENWLANEVLQY